MFKVECDFIKWSPATEENCYTLKFITQELLDEQLLLIKAHKGRHGKIIFDENG